MSKWFRSASIFQQIAASALQSWPTDSPWKRPRITDALLSWICRSIAWRLYDQGQRCLYEYVLKGNPSVIRSPQELRRITSAWRASPVGHCKGAHVYTTGNFFASGLITGFRGLNLLQALSHRPRANNDHAIDQMGGRGVICKSESRFDRFVHFT